jgi:hypothetical protein
MSVKTLCDYFKLIFFVLFAFSCNRQKSEGESKHGSPADTILFANDRIPVPPFRKAVTTPDDLKALIFQFIGAGKSIWIDSIYYDQAGSKGFFMIARTVQSIEAI